ncbi:hypothetical protein [Clostridium butyricum]
MVGKEFKNLRIGTQLKIATAIIILFTSLIVLVGLGSLIKKYIRHK